jgi:hypothetical protein
MANVSVYRRLSNVLQGKTSRNRCVACVAVSVAQNPAGSLELPSPDARKTQQQKRYLTCRGFSEMSGSQQDTDVVSVEQEVAIYLSGFVATHC